MANSNFNKFVELIRSGSVSIIDDEVVVSFSTAPDAQSVEQTLSDIGYDFDDVRTYRKGKLNISLNAEYWNGDSVLWRSWQDLYEYAVRSSSIPDSFYIIESEQSSLDGCTQAKQIELFCRVRQLLAALSDHCVPDKGVAKGSQKLLFIVDTENNACKHEFKPKVDWPFVSALPDATESIEAVIKLEGFLSVGDKQDSERRSVMRSALNDLISTCHSTDAIFPTILKSAREFLNKYEEHHELFVKRFSVNKILHEINEQDLKYTSKINEIISGAQNKALALPGALIAIGAIMKIDHWSDGLAVAIGVLITSFIVHRALNVHLATFNHIKKQVKSDFKRYDNLNENAEIRKQAKTTNKELTQLLKKAEDDAKTIKTVIWVVFAVAIAFICFSVSNIK
ncbi:MAG: hypothetical protein MK214_15700 [Thalassotalea sp.]|nr:hypothetical protein [Thalassotalea sp.]